MGNGSPQFQSATQQMDQSLQSMSPAGQTAMYGSGLPTIMNMISGNSNYTPPYLSNTPPQTQTPQTSPSNTSNATSQSNSSPQTPIQTPAPWTPAQQAITQQSFSQFPSNQYTGLWNMHNQGQSPLGMLASPPPQWSWT